ncbi:MAG: hypothetical protein AAB853_04155 [Patescibacteria group bacterium]
MEGLESTGSEKWGAEALSLLESVQPQIREAVRAEAQARALTKRRNGVTVEDVRGAHGDVVAVQKNGNFDPLLAVLGTMAWMRSLAEKGASPDRLEPLRDALREVRRFVGEQG